MERGKEGGELVGEISVVLTHCLSVVVCVFKTHVLLVGQDRRAGMHISKAGNSRLVTRVPHMGFQRLIPILFRFSDTDTDLLTNIQYLQF